MKTLSVLFLLAVCALPLAAQTPDTPPSVQEDGTTMIIDTTIISRLTLEVYPNPSPAQVDVQVDLPVSTSGHLELLNGAGKTLRSWKVKERTLLHVPVIGLTARRYWLRLGTDAAVVTKPLVVQ